MKVGYHITMKKNIPSILKTGLIPKMPLDYEDIKGVYLFKTLEDVETALYQWMGERIDGIEDATGRPYLETLLTVNLDGLDDDLIDSVEYEWICTVLISPERILSINYEYH